MRWPLGLAIGWKDEMTQAFSGHLYECTIVRVCVMYAVTFYYNKECGKIDGGIFYIITIIIQV